MTDERLRALERRWQETNAAEDWAAFLREQLRTGTGIVREAQEFLTAARDFARTIKHPGIRAEALGRVAWGCVALEDQPSAVEVVAEIRRAVADAGSDDLWAARALARVGAVESRVKGTLGGEDLEASLGTILRVFPQGPTESPEDVDARNALAAWFQAEADRQECVDSDFGLVAVAWERASAHPSVVSAIVEESRTDLIRLGLGAEAHAALWRGLQKEGLDRLRTEVSHLQYPIEAFKVSVQNAAHSLLLLADAGDAVVGARHVLSLVGELPEVIDEFVAEPLQLALERLPVHEAWEAAEHLVNRVGDSYQRTLVQITVIAWAGGDERGRAMHEEALETARSLDDSKGERRRAVTRLLKLLPQVISEPLVLGRFEPFRDEDSGFFARTEYLLAEIDCVSQFSKSTAPELLLDIARRTVTGFLEAAGSDEPRWLCFEVLDTCVVLSVKMGEVAVTRSVLELVREASLKAADSTFGKQRLSEELSFYARSLAHVAFAELAIGEEERFDRDRTRVAEWAKLLRDYDASELFEEVLAVRCACSHPLQRPAVGRWILGLSAPLVARGNQDRFALDLLTKLCRDVLRFEA